MPVRAGRARRLAEPQRMNAMDRQRTLPVRKKLPHDIPTWVSAGARYFITINCRRRGADVLCVNGVGESLIESIGVYQYMGRWYPWLTVIMPDHVHMIASFHSDVGIARTVKAWKSYNAKRSGIEWQSGFFEHRLRSVGEFDEKTAYVRNNPVRKGLVADAASWPYVWEGARG
jgi:REP element-mobilizing transposase RayT